MTVYMKCDDIKGNVTAKGYADHIELIGVENPGISTPIFTPTGRDANRVSSHPFFSKITVYKRIDESSMDFFHCAHSHSSIPTVQIKFLSVGSNKELTAHAEWQLTDVLISHYSEYHDPANGMVELMQLDYKSIVKSYTPRDAKNNPKAPVRSGFHIPRGEAM